MTSPPANYEKELVPTNKSELTALTGIRFFAAFLVVLDHFSGNLLKTFPDNGSWSRFLLYRLFGGGAEGVGFFFVLSGFILTYNYQRQNGQFIGTLRNFYVARFARIYPAYLVGLLLALAPFFWLPSDPVRPFWITAAWTLLLLQGWDWNRDARPLNGPGWTLSVEAFFYLLFPWLVRGLARLERRGLALLLFASFVATFSGAYLERKGLVSFGTAMQGPLFRIPEFVIGLVFGRMFVLRIGRSLLSRLSSEAILCVVAVLFAIVGVLPYDLRHNAPLALFYGVLIYSLALGKGPSVRILSSPILLLLGEASYGLYIIHYPILNFMDHYQVGALPWYRFSAYACLAVSMSVLIFLWLETPARRLIRRHLSGTTPQLASSATRRA